MSASIFLLGQDSTFNEGNCKRARGSRHYASYLIEKERGWNDNSRMSAWNALKIETQSSLGGSSAHSGVVGLALKHENWRGIGLTLSLSLSLSLSHNVYISKEMLRIRGQSDEFLRDYIATIHQRHTKRTRNCTLHKCIVARIEGIEQWPIPNVKCQLRWGRLALIVCPRREIPATIKRAVLSVFRGFTFFEFHGVYDREGILRST